MRTVTLRGEEFYVHDNEALSNAVVRDNDYFEDHILDYVLNIAPVQDVILDVGANIGNHTNFFARFFEYQSIGAYEPIQENFELLAKNTARFPNVFIEQHAVSNFTGTVTMHRHWSNFGSHGIAYPNWSPSLYEPGGIEVGCITLDSLNIQSMVTLLKIDAEMHEPQILEGAANLIERCKPLILIEDVFRQYGTLPQLQGYSLIKEWIVDYTYLYKWGVV
jgi:FkbM family methyltransferase